LEFGVKPDFEQKYSLKPFWIKKLF